MEKEIKKCPYCGEEILAEANKCKHCGEWLDKGKSPTPFVTESTNQKYLELYKRGEKLLAIKMFKEETGCSLNEAKDTIDTLWLNLSLEEKKEPDSQASFVTESTDSNVKPETVIIVEEPEGNVGSMEKETKKCPYCGEEILTEANKCKHCGEWLDKGKAPTPIVAESTDPKVTPETVVLVEEPEGEVSSLLIFECVIIVGILTFLYDWSLWWILGALAVVYILLSISRVIRIITSVVFSALWGFIATLLSPWIFDESELKMASRLVNGDYADYWYVGLIVFIVSLLYHMNDID